MDQLRPTTPCPKRWGDLDGQGTTRHCGACNLQVTNLSELTRDDAKTFLDGRSGRTCIAVEQRADGTTVYSEAGTLHSRAGAWRRAIAAALPAFLLPWLPGCGSAEPEPAPDPHETPAATDVENPARLVGEIEMLMGSVPTLRPTDELRPLMGKIGPRDLEEE